MKYRIGNDQETRFARAWSSWLRRPLRSSPEVAAARVARLLQESPPRRRPVWVLATAGVSLAVLATLVLVLPRQTGTDFSGPPAPPPATVQPVQPGEVLIWLDDETPLYMHFQPPATREGSES